jgi:hypothetical protein
LPNLLVRLWLLQLSVPPLVLSWLVLLLALATVQAHRLLSITSTASNLISSHPWKTNLISALVSSSACSTVTMTAG